MKSKFKSIMFSCLLVICITSLASAHIKNDCINDGTAVVRDSALSSSYYVDGTKDTGLQVEKNSSSGYYNITTGTLNLDIRNKNNSGSDPASWLNFQAYCIEKDQNIKFGTNPTDTAGYGYDVVDLSSYGGISSSDVDFLGKLWANAFDISTTGDVEAAAFQALVWETVYDSDIDLDDDNFDLYRTNDFTKDVFALANEWIDNIDNGLWTSTVDLFVLHSDCSQDFITTVPEPSSMALAMLGGMMLMGRGRRKNRIA